MAKPKPNSFGFQVEALAWNAYTGGLSALGLERASRWGAAIVPAIAPINSAWKTAIRNILVNLCATNLLATTHKKNLSLLTAHQRTNDFINQTVLDQRLNSLWYFQNTTASGI